MNSNRIFAFCIVCIKLSLAGKVGNSFTALSDAGGIVGVYYSTWFPSVASWEDNATWGTPLLGPYASSNVTVLRQHAEWLVCAGVDFIVVDWSNNIACFEEDGGALCASSSSPRSDLWSIQDATNVLFSTFNDMNRAPKVAIMTGASAIPDHYAFPNSALSNVAQYVFEEYVARYPNVYMRHLGKPLLLDYVGTPVPFADPPKPYDPRFTTRFVTGFRGDQPDASLEYWSWEERKPGVTAYWNGFAEATVVTAASRGDPGTLPTPIPPMSPWLIDVRLRPRRNGTTFITDWQSPIEEVIPVVMVQSFNEWYAPNEELDAELSNDIEPSEEQGMFYLQLLQDRIAEFKRQWGVKYRACILE